MRVACLLGIASAVLGVAFPAASRDFRSSDIYSADYPTVKAVAFMADLLRERSGGRLTIRDLGAGDRESENFSIAQVRNGTLDMARVNLAALNAAVPASVVPSLPYLFKSTQHARTVLDGVVGTEILAALETAGLTGLCFYDAGSRSLYTARKPVRTLADIAGMRVRVQQSDSAAEMMRAVGAEPVTMSLDRVSVALQTGAIDAAEGSLPSYTVQGHHRMARYYNLTEHSRPPGVLLFSRHAWRKLSQADQALIRAAARESVAYYRAVWDEYEATARRTVEAEGAEIVTGIDHKSFADAMMPLFSVVLRDPKLALLVDRIRSERHQVTSP